MRLQEIIIELPAETAAVIHRQPALFRCQFRQERSTECTEATGPCKRLFHRREIKPELSAERRLVTSESDLQNVFRNPGGTRGGAARKTVVQTQKIVAVEPETGAQFFRAVP